MILDQFEERFLYASTADDAFDDELAACIVDRAVPAHFLISVREDAYALIGERFKSRIPNVYGNYLHLDFLDERRRAPGGRRARGRVQPAPPRGRGRMGHRARAGRRRARRGPARARDDRGRRAGGGAVRRRRARRDRLSAARDAADLGRGDDGRLTVAARRDAPPARRRGHDRPSARRRRAHRHARRGARRRIGGAALPRDVGRPEDRAEHDGAPRVHGRPGRSRWSRRSSGSSAAGSCGRSPHRRGRGGPAGAVPRRARAGGARLATSPRHERSVAAAGSWRRPATGRGCWSAATAVSRRR